MREDQRVLTRRRAVLVGDPGGPRRRSRGASTASVRPGCPAPGYLCEVCLDAPAVQLQPAPWGGEMGGCVRPVVRQGEGQTRMAELRDPHAFGQANVGWKLRSKQSWRRRPSPLQSGPRTSRRWRGERRKAPIEACPYGWPRRRRHGPCPLRVP